MVIRSLALAIAAAVLAACTVGPDHVRPDLPVQERFVQGQAAGAQAGEAAPARPSRSA